MTPIATVRASSWPTLFDCPHRWYWQNIVKLKTPWSGAALLGTAVHAGTGRFDTQRLRGEATSIEEAVDVSRAELAEKSREVEWDERLDARSADGFAISLTARYCETIAPTRRYAAVELPCEALDISTEHGTVRLTGTTDRVRILPDGSMGIADLKTGGRATEKTPDGRRRAVTKGHHLQLGIYTLMAEAASGERLDGPAEIIGLQTTKETPVATGEVADVKTPLLGTDEAPGLIELAAGMLKSGIFPPNPKSMLCSAKYCAAHVHGKCIYHE
jgi:RecB family exonuclease